MQVSRILYYPKLAHEFNFIVSEIEYEISYSISNSNPQIFKSFFCKDQNVRKKNARKLRFCCRSLLPSPAAVGIFRIVLWIARCVLDFRFSPVSYEREGKYLNIIIFATKLLPFDISDFLFITILSLYEQIV